MPKLKKRSTLQQKSAKCQQKRATRQDSERRKSEQEANTAARRVTRGDEQRRLKEQDKNTISRQLSRQDNDRRKSEQEADTAARRVTRGDEHRRLKEQDKNTISRQLSRQDNDRRKLEQEADTAARRVTRGDEQRRLKEQDKNTILRRQTREDEQRRLKEQEKNTILRQLTRQDNDRRKSEQEADTAARRVTRGDEQRRLKEQDKNTISRQLARQYNDRRKSEQEADTAARRVTRGDEQRRLKEQAKNTISRHLIRTLPTKRAAEKLTDAAAKRKKRKLARSSYENLLQIYRDNIKCAPSFICSCCGNLWYEESTFPVSEEKLKEWGCKEELIATVLHVPQNQHRLCSTCKKSVIKNTVPRLCLANGFDFPEIPEELKDLSPLEERLVSPRLPFMQIRLRGRERQSFLRGNIVNVENDLDVCAQVLPRTFDESSTVLVKLMRRMRYRAPYIYETIRPQKVYNAAKFLINSELYESEGIALSDDWKICDENGTLSDDWRIFEEGTSVPFLNPDDTDDVLEGIEPNPMERDIRSQNENNVNQNLEENDIQLGTQNLGVEETLIFQENNICPSSNGIRIAPGEGKTPIALYKDLNAEELSFPTIYAGKSRKFQKTAKITYTDIAKSELRRYDRRACRPSKILYSFKRSFNEKVHNAVQICMRKKIGQKGVTVRNIRTPGYIEKLIRKDEGYAVFKQLRSSPSYWKEKIKKVLGMVRQLGKCTFFITLSAAETKWKELLVMLMKIVKDKVITEEEALLLTFEEIAELIRSDPVTCIRHFDHRQRQLLNLLLKPKDFGIFGPYNLQDFFTRLEFQMRGSPHSHGLFWIEDAPTYEEGNPESVKECTKFIDRFITCERSEEGEMENLIGYQIHKHSQTCLKKVKKGQKCRFGFPKPLMEETRILTPLPKNLDPKEKKKATELYLKVQNKLNEWGREFKEDIDYDDFLDLLDTTHMDYIYAVRSSIKRPTVFLRRATNSTFVNGYNLKLLEAWGANIDVQFVLDTYACAKYCVAYILKSDGGLSKLLHEANQDAKKGDAPYKDKLKKFSSVLLNGTEMSAQEASAFLLGIPNTRCSRQDVFINTSLPEERIGMLKTQEVLSKLSDEDDDICVRGIIDRYSLRPKEMEDMCLGEFASMYEFTKANSKLTRSGSLHSLQLSDIEQGEESQTESIPDCSQQKDEKLMLLDSSGYLRKRTVRKIIRFVHFGKEQDPLNYYREQLMLFVPWREEEEELIKCDPLEKAQQLHGLILKNSEPFFKNRNIDDGILEMAFEEAEDEEEEDGSQTRIENDLELQEERESFEQGFVENVTLTQSRIEQFRPLRLISDVDYAKTMQTLNSKQQKYLIDVLHRMKTNTAPFYSFLSGGAGVGKSHAITAIVQSYMRYNNNIPSADPHTNPDDACVLVAAPTGKAAFNVYGMTLHCTFKLPPTQYGGKVCNLSDEAVNSMRLKLNNVKLFIIDEVSMVSVRQLYDIDQRLRQIFSTNEDFGGKSIIVVGHLRQLAPVMGSHVFKSPSFLPLGDLVGNHLWEKFMLFELDEIMRQKGDAKFCKALNNMAEGCMDSEDISLIKSREINSTNQPPKNAIRLCSTNEECQNYNAKVHQELQSEGALSTAHDLIQGSGTDDQKRTLLEYAKTLTTQQSDGIPYTTHLQVDGEYFVSTNIDVDDGLFNGSTGSLKMIEYGTTKHNERIPKKAWVDFRNPLIGAKKRSETKTYQERKSINLKWTLIDRITRNLSKTGRHRGLEIIRTQIPLVAANAMTIAKSQGSSLPQVVVSVNRYKTHAGRMTRKLTRELMYVACSRATSLAGLYIDGTFEPPNAPADDDPVSVEMARLRAIPYNWSINFLQDIGEEYEKVYFHNIRSIGIHYQDLIADRCAMGSNYLAFVEPHLLTTDKINLPNFTCLHRTNCQDHRNSEGALIFAKNYNETQDTPNIQVDRSLPGKGHCLTLNWNVHSVSVVMLYKHPEYPNSKFLNGLEKTLQQNKKDIVVFGDINIDFRKPEGKRVNDLFKKYNLSSKLNLEDFSTDRGTKIDCCFSNMSHLTAWFYESYYSDHKPICIIWPRNVDLP